MQLKKIGVKMRMTGKMTNAVKKMINAITLQQTNAITLQQLFNTQLMTQDKLIHKGVYDRYKDEHTVTVPADDVGLASYHIQHLLSEIGEVLDADKRWKSYRNNKYDKNAKLEELADCFVVLMNIAMFSGFDGNDLANAIQQKLGVVSDRIETL